MSKLCISARAYRALSLEVSRYPDAETGGMLLGYREDDGFTVVEATDGGYRNVSRTPHEFAYDTDYQAHMCRVLRELYHPPLVLIGLWHTHNTLSEQTAVDVHAGTDLGANAQARIFKHADQACCDGGQGRVCPLSHTDRETHQALIHQNPTAELSVLIEKEGEGYNMRAFCLSKDGYAEITDLVLQDG